MTVPSLLRASRPRRVSVATQDGSLVGVSSVVADPAIPEDARAATYEYLLVLDEVELAPPYSCDPRSLVALVGKSLRASFRAPGLPGEATVDGLRLRQVAYTLTGVGLFLDLPVPEPLDLSRA